MGHGTGKCTYHLPCHLGKLFESLEGLVHPRVVQGRINWSASVRVLCALWCREGQITANTVVFANPPIKNN